MAAGDALRYPMVLRAGGRREVEPKWEKWGGGRAVTALTSKRGRRRWRGQILGAGRRSDGGGGRKSSGEGGFSRGVLRSEDGEGWSLAARSERESNRGAGKKIRSVTGVVPFLRGHSGEATEEWGRVRQREHHTAQGGHGVWRRPTEVGSGRAHGAEQRSRERTRRGPVMWSRGGGERGVRQWTAPGRQRLETGGLGLHEAAISCGQPNRTVEGG
jgi:hypothetical protein